MLYAGIVLLYYLIFWPLSCSSVPLSENGGKWNVWNFCVLCFLHVVFVSWRWRTGDCTSKIALNGEEFFLFFFFPFLGMLMNYFGKSFGFDFQHRPKNQACIVLILTRMWSSWDLVLLHSNFSYIFFFFWIIYMWINQIWWILHNRMQKIMSTRKEWIHRWS